MEAAANVAQTSAGIECQLRAAGRPTSNRMRHSLCKRRRNCRIAAAAAAAFRSSAAAAEAERAEAHLARATSGAAGRSRKHNGPPPRGRPASSRIQNRRGKCRGGARDVSASQASNICHRRRRPGAASFPFGAGQRSARRLVRGIRSAASRRLKTLQERAGSRTRRRRRRANVVGKWPVVQCRPQRARRRLPCGSRAASLPLTQLLFSHWSRQ